MRCPTNIMSFLSSEPTAKFLRRLDQTLDSNTLSPAMNMSSTWRKMKPWGRRPCALFRATGSIRCSVASEVLTCSVLTLRGRYFRRLLGADMLAWCPSHVMPAVRNRWSSTWNRPSGSVALLRILPARKSWGPTRQGMAKGGMFMESSGKWLQQTPTLRIKKNLVFARLVEFLSWHWLPLVIWGFCWGIRGACQLWMFCGSSYESPGPQGIHKCQVPMHLD